MSPVCYTSIYGQYDPLRAHPDHPAVDAWLCFTDDPNLTAPGWETIVEPARYPHPRLSAKWRKCHPPEADWSLWIDGCIDLRDAAFVDVVGTILKDADLALFPHADRDNIVDEALVSAIMPKYHGHDVIGQVERYRDRRNTAGRLYASTIIGRNHTPAVLQMGAAWMAHCELLTYQDQLSLPVMLEDYGLTVGDIPGWLTRNPWFAWCGHGANEHR